MSGVLAERYIGSIRNLYQKYLDDGRNLIHLLNIRGFKVNAAMWYYSSETDMWKFLIASPYVSRSGTNKSYMLIQSILRELPESDLSLDKISVIKLNDPIIRLVRKVKHGGEFRFNGYIDGILIEDAYIYVIN